MKKAVIILSKWKYWLTIVFIGLYSYILPYGFIVIDPCSNTPGHDDTVGIILVCLFPLLLGLLIYFLFAYRAIFRFKSFLKNIALSVAWLLSAFIFLVIECGLFYKLIDHTSIRFPDYLVVNGCYNEKEMTDLFVWLLYMTDILFVGLIIYLIVKRKHK
jgi:hypothetical protein